MTANAVPRSIRSIMKHPRRGDRLNILTFATHERYEYNLCKTGHDFYSLAIGKTWDTEYSPIPDNYHIINELPNEIDFDLILSHTACNRYDYAHQLLSGVTPRVRKIKSDDGSIIVDRTKNIAIPSILHIHVLPDIRGNVDEQVLNMQSFSLDKTSFISDFSRRAWGYNESNSSIIEHGIDTDFWKSAGEERKKHCLSVVNDWPNRDWCCGFNLWKDTIADVPALVVGKSPGFSFPAKNPEHLRQIYSSSMVFYNTSLHSPVPTVLLEAMSCGCAIVSTATCMIPDIISHGHNGLISNNPSELKDFLVRLLNDEQEAKRLGDNARKTIKEKFGIKRFCDDWNELFYSTIEEHKGQA